MAVSKASSVVHEHTQIKTTARLVDEGGVPYELERVECSECGQVLSRRRKRIIT